MKLLRKRKLLYNSLICLFIVIIISTLYAIYLLHHTISEVNFRPSVQQRILDLVPSIERRYTKNRPENDNIGNVFISNVNFDSGLQNLSEIWKIARSWISPTQLYDINNSNIGSVLRVLKTAKIIRADVDTRGTQLKLLLTLEGNQLAVFKPKWYPIDKIIEGPVYAGKDRYGAEIVAFYLSALYGKPLVPIVTERKISLKKDIYDVATKRLRATMFETQDGSWCMYGKCYYCAKEDPICEDNSGSLTGAIVFNINATFKNNRSPWQRTYKKNKLADWEENENYCGLVKGKLSERRITDLIDAAIFDFLLQNGDRHHYETLGSNVVLIDNGKGLGNPNVHHLDILAPLYQCCMLRNVTKIKLEQLLNGSLRKAFEQIPDIDKFLTPKHLSAIERRLLIVQAAIEYCRERLKRSSNKIDRDIFK